MTENLETVSEQETPEPQPNMYNAKKPWHTPDVMPTDNPQTADSLFIEKASPTEEVEEAPKQKRTSYKKRYDDLKKHYDSKLTEFRGREAELVQKLQADRPEYVAPKTVEELETFKNQYPEVYDVVESVAHLQSEKKMESLQQQISTLSQREQELLKREAEKDLVTKHPDFSTLRESDDFHVWAKNQPEEIQGWIYKNPDNASLASRAIDLYKADTSLGQSAKSRQQSRQQVESAAEFVSIKTQSVDTDEPRIWTQEEIAALPMDEYDRLEAEIDLAVKEGRVRV